MGTFLITVEQNGKNLLPVTHDTGFVSWSTVLHYYVVTSLKYMFFPFIGYSSFVNQSVPLKHNNQK